MDIGGGTTELILGDAKDHHFLESLKLGAIRLAAIFPVGSSGKISKKKYANMLDYVRGAASHTFRKIRDQGFDVAYGSSGTIMNLAEITARRKDSITSLRNHARKFDDLGEPARMLCSLNLDERRNVPGINPERADIIVSGAAILEAVMAGTGADSIRISDRALRDGIIVDHLFQEEMTKNAFLSTSVRQRSILQLCRSCRFEESHASKVTELACSLFRQLGSLGLHPYGEKENELLRYAAMVHDVGTFISRLDHHKHGYYLVRNWGLLGFDDGEVEILATAAMCHRKLSPRKAVPAALGSAVRMLIEVMASVLRVADALDRSQLGLVREVICRSQQSQNQVVLEVYASEDCPLEMWALENKKSLMEQTFEIDVSVKRFVS